MGSFSIYHWAIFAIVFVIVFGIYFLPAIIAISNNRKNKVAITVLNIFLGWTFIGWVGSLVWALMKD
jgi:hypothetical protein